MIGKTISHYKILEKLGEGGMGVVYKAEDTKLKRTVALKFLPREYSSDIAAKERFVHEAQAASALDHPNICTIHEIGETDDDQSYIAMACYDGQSLKSKIDSDELTIEKSIDIIIQISKGLKRAHEAGIVHRDIKPANIIITEHDEVKILDFGLAKLAGQTRLTKEGMTVGTIAYMSPEQAHGEQVNHRSDIWSLGVILYEMLSGQLPFRGEYEQAIIYSIINEEPEKISDLNDDLPPELDKIISKCLSKNPEHRYQSMEELLIDFKPFSTEAAISVDESISGIMKRLWHKKKFRRLSTISAVATIVISISAYVLLFVSDSHIDSLAILPFVNTTGNEEAEYLSNGIPESVISDMQKIPDLRLASFSSLLYRYKDKANDPQIVGKEMNVESVAMGRMTLQGDDITINIEIIDTRDNSILLAKEYIEKLANLFEIRTKIARDITENLRLELTGEEKIKLLQTPKVDNLAFDYYMKGRNLWYKRNLESIKKATFYFEKAIEIDSSYALAWSGLADTYMQQYADGGVPLHTIIPKAKKAAERALKLDPTLAQSHTSMARVYRFKGELNKAIEQAKIAIRLNPNYIYAYFNLGRFLELTGNLEESIEIYEKALQIDPLDPYILGNQAYTYQRSGQIEKAEELCKENILLNPEYAGAYMGYAMLLSSLDKHEEAIKMATKAVEIDSLSTWTINTAASMYINAEAYEQAINLYQKTLRQIPEFSIDAHIGLGRVYRKMGNFEQAIWHHKQAIEIDPLNEDAYWSLGYCYRIMGEYEKSVVQFQQCAQLKPAAAWKHSVYGDALYIIGRHNAAINEYKKEVTLDPKSWIALVLGYFYAEMFEESIDYFEQNVDSTMISQWDNYRVAYVYLFQKDYKRGVQYMHTFLEEKNFEKRNQCFDKAFKNNQFDEFSTKEYIECIMEEIERTKYPQLKGPITMARNYAYIGEIDKAFEQLNRAYDEQSMSLAIYLKSAFSNELKSDPRYDVLIKNLKLEKYVN